MKKTTIFALTISLIYCLSSSYVLYNISKGNLWSPSDYLDNFLFPGYTLGFIGGYSGGVLFLILGQIITFLILFYILKTTLNWLVYELQKHKT